MNGEQINSTGENEQRPGWFERLAVSLIKLANGLLDVIQFQLTGHVDTEGQTSSFRDNPTVHE